MSDPTDMISPFLTHESLIETLQSLVSINSVNPDYGGPQGGESRVIEWVRTFLNQHGIASETFDAAPGRPVMIARLAGVQPDRVFLFNTHVDTVSVEGMSVDPFAGEIRNRCLWGRGSTDAKGQATAMLHAMVALAAADEKPPFTIELVLTVGEEYDFLGARALAERGITAEAAVVGEPTDLDVVVAHKGTMRWWIETQGRAVHSAKPHLGVNAIEKAARIIQAIQEQIVPELNAHSHPLLGAATINVSKIDGGIQVNLVPPSARMLIDRRTLPGETSENILKRFDDMFENFRRDDPDFHAKHVGLYLDDPPLETDPTHPLVRVACDLVKQFNREGKPLGVPYGTDGSKIARCGVPTIIVGPGSIDQAHTADEFIQIDELVAGARFYHQLMMAGPGL